MNCKQCQTANPDSARFCMKCGAAVPGACGKCGAELADGAQFCSSCGQPTAAAAAPSAATSRLSQYIPRELLAKLESGRARGAVHSERRVVTMLFCDVKGSTAAAGQLDPEEWAEIMNGVFEHLISPVYKYEGTLARLMGDAVLAFFGAPIAHEDDPQRAVLAALEIVDGIRRHREAIRRRWGLDIDVRVGINSGLVVVGEVGTDLRVEYTAMGDAVNLAARMEQTADPGTVQVTEQTYRLVAPLFDAEGPVAREVKGKSDPVAAWVVTGRKAAPGSLRGIEGLSSPLVGRDAELRALRDAVASLRAGSGQIASIIAEAGLGKSRLTAELARAVVAEGGVAWHEGRSLSFETSTPYAPFVDLLGGMLGLRGEPAGSVSYGRLKSALAGLVPSSAAETAPFIASVLGVKAEGDDLERIRYLQPPQLRGRVFAAVCSVVEEMATARPLVLVFEDLHWSDATSLELAAQLMPITERAMLMVLALFRPQQQEPSWRFHEIGARDFAHRYTSVQLKPLDDDQSRQLVANLLTIEDLPARVRTLILQKAEGNPFFVEEVIRSLLDARLVVRDEGHWRATREIENIAVPDTLAGVLTARLDRLDEGSRRAAQTASVIGREFQYEALRALHDDATGLDEALGKLMRRGLVREKSRLPPRAYVFKHGLTQEAAYGSLLLARRRELHRRAGEHLEKVERSRVNDIARHFLEARESARAVPFLVEAGERAAAAYSARDAISYFEKALEILTTERDAALARRAYEGLGGVLMMALDIPRALAIYERMLADAVAYAVCEMEVSARNKIARTLVFMTGQVERVEEQLRSAEALATKVDDLGGQVESCMVRCAVCTFEARFEDAVGHLSHSEEIGRKYGLKEPLALGQTHIANTLTYMTRFDDAWKTAQEALGVAREIGNQELIAELLAFSVPWKHLREGDLESARASAQEAADVATRIGGAMPLADSMAMLVLLARLRGDYESALRLGEKSVAVAQASGIPWSIASALCALGTVHIEISETNAAKAIELHSQALAMLDHPLAGVNAAAILAELGFCALTLGELEIAARHFDRGLASRTPPMYLARPLLLFGATRIALARGRVEEAARFADEATAYVDERAMVTFQPMAQLSSGTVRAARGDVDGALAAFAGAEARADTLGMRPTLFEARVEAARLLGRAGRRDGTEAKRSSARDVAAQMASLFHDAEMGARFTASANRRLAMA